MATTTVEDILKHHGVKGMRWGVRNKPDSKSSASSKSSPKKAHELSDEELKKHIDRMQLEKNFNELMPPKASKSASAVKFIKDFADVGSSVAKIALSTQQVKSVMKTK